jgi:hypothetical protein
MIPPSDSLSLFLRLHVIHTGFHENNCNDCNSQIAKLRHEVFQGDENIAVRLEIVAATTE